MPSKHTEEPGMWCQGRTWASRIIPQVFPSGAGTWHTLERHSFPTEEGRNILHGPTAACCHCCLPWQAHPSQAGPAPALLVLLGRNFHSQKLSFVSWGRWDSWNQNCVKVCPAEHLQRNLTNFFFSRRMPDRAWRCFIPPKRCGTVKQLCRYSQDYCKIPTVTGQRSAHHSLQKWLFILYNSCISQLSLVNPLLGCYWVSGLKLSQHRFCW